MRNLIVGKWFFVLLMLANGIVGIISPANADPVDPIWGREGDRYPSTGYFKAVFGGRCLDVRYGNSANRTPVQIYDCNGTPAQRWWTPMGNVGGVFNALGGDWGKVLDAPYTVNYSTTWLFDWWGGDNQKWYMPRIELVSRIGFNKCLTITADTNPDGSRNADLMRLYTCFWGENQFFFWDMLTREIRTRDGRCLGVYHTPDAIGDAVRVFPCDGSIFQKWYPNSNSGNGNERLVTWWGACMYITNGSTADGTSIRIGGCGGGDEQRFYARGQLIGYQSGKCLQIPRDQFGNINNGNWIMPVLNDCSGDIAQQWEYHWE